jgi:hypothetical protein
MLRKVFFFVFLAVTSCADSDEQKTLLSNQADYLHRSVKKLTDVIIHDIFSPPVASRIYVYSSIAAFEALVPGNPELQSLAGQLNGLNPLPQPESNAVINHQVASIRAFLTVGKTLIFSENQIEEFENEVFAEIKKAGIKNRVFKASIDYGNLVAQHILDWSKSDLYSETRTYPKFAVNNEPSRWQPTPPDYMDGIEPHWKKIRPLVLESSDQFLPAPPTPFSLDPQSLFMKEVMEVYAISQREEDFDEKIQIAKFWDCNPYVSNHIGHVMYAVKKITPGGHWMGIAAIAAKTGNADFVKTSETYALTSIGLFDAFISCWDEKYRSNLVRPETVINKFVDENWVPSLQTPPFPEYTSGHSVISRSAALMLTSLYGEQFPYEDTVELEYGLPSRTFQSFLQASDEAAVSRIYAGIHFRPAVENGVIQGDKVGKWILAKVQTRKN